VPPVLLLPWTVQAATNPSGLLLEAGLQQPGLATRDLPARSLLLLSPGGPGLPPVWVTAGIAVAAVAALLLARRRALMLAGWGIALSGLLVAVAVSRVVVTPGTDEPAVSAWPGAALLIAALGLLLAGATAGEDIPRLVRGIGDQGADGPASPRGGRKGGGRAAGRGPRTLRGVGVAALAAVACSAPLLAAASWVISGVRGPVGPVSGPVIPAVVAASLGNGLQQRTLVLRPAGSQVSFSLQRGISPSLGDPDLDPVPAAQRALTTAVAALVAPDGGEAVDQGQLLSQFDIGFVLLPTPVDQSLARVLNGVSGLHPVSSTAAFALWQVTGVSARVRVVEPNGAVVAVPSGALGVSSARVPSAGGTLELAEPAGGWSASLNGHPLTPVTSPAGSWAQAFRLPAGGGVLAVGRSQIGRDVILILELLAVLVVAGLALPGSRSAEESAAPAGGSRTRAGSRARVPAAVGAAAAVADAGETDEADSQDSGARTPGRIAARGRPGRGRRRDREAAPGQRRGRRTAAGKPGSRSAGRRSAVPGGPPAAAGPPGSAGRRPGGEAGGGLPRPRVPWPAGEPAAAAGGESGDDPAGRGAGWADDAPAGAGPGWASAEHAGWAEDAPAGDAPGWPSAGYAGWPDDAPAGAGPGWASAEHAGWAEDAPAGDAPGWPSAGYAGWPDDEPAGAGPGWPSAGYASGTEDGPAGGGQGWAPAERAGRRRDEPASPGAGWPSDQPPGWPSGDLADQPPGWPSAGHSGSAGQPPAPAHRSPSGTWPPPDQAERWASGEQGGWPAAEPSTRGERGDMLDPLPPAGRSRHRLPEPDDDEGAAGYRGAGGDAW
jgi:hypothetical protein